MAARAQQREHPWRMFPTPSLLSFSPAGAAQAHVRRPTAARPSTSVGTRDLADLAARCIVNTSAPARPRSLHSLTADSLAPRCRRALRSSIWSVTLPRMMPAATSQNTYLLTGRFDYNLSQNTQLFFRYGRESPGDLPGAIFCQPLSAVQRRANDLQQQLPSCP